jgi:pectinesterase
MGAHIRPEGWNNWSSPDNEKTAYYAEYDNTGPGSNDDQRVPWSKKLTRTEAREYLLDKIFADPLSNEAPSDWYNK